MIQKAVSQGDSPLTLWQSKDVFIEWGARDPSELIESSQTSKQTKTGRPIDK